MERGGGGKVCSRGSGKEGEDRREREGDVDGGTVVDGSGRDADCVVIEG